jgi:hypothetical protein
LHPVDKKGEAFEIIGALQFLVGAVAFAVYAVEFGPEVLHTT